MSAKRRGLGPAEEVVGCDVGVEGGTVALKSQRSRILPFSSSSSNSRLCSYPIIFDVNMFWDIHFLFITGIEFSYRTSTDSR